MYAKGNKSIKQNIKFNQRAGRLAFNQTDDFNLENQGNFGFNFNKETNLTKDDFENKKSKNLEAGININNGSFTITPFYMISEFSTSLTTAGNNKLQANNMKDNLSLNTNNLAKFEDGGNTATNEQLTTKLMNTFNGNQLNGLFNFSANVSENLFKSLNKVYGIKIKFSY